MSLNLDIIRENQWKCHRIMACTFNRTVCFPGATVGEVVSIKYYLYELHYVRNFVKFLLFEPHKHPVKRLISFFFKNYSRDCLGGSVNSKCLLHKPKTQVWSLGGRETNSLSYPLTFTHAPWHATPTIIHTHNNNNSNNKWKINGGESRDRGLRVPVEHRVPDHWARGFCLGDESSRWWWQLLDIVNAFGATLNHTL